MIHQKMCAVLLVLVKLGSSFFANENMNARLLVLSHSASIWPNWNCHQLKASQNTHPSTHHHLILFLHYSNPAFQSHLLLLIINLCLIDNLLQTQWGDVVWLGIFIVRFHLSASTRASVDDMQVVGIGRFLYWSTLHFVYTGIPLAMELCQYRRNLKRSWSQCVPGCSCSHTNNQKFGQWHAQHKTALLGCQCLIPVT